MADTESKMGTSTTKAPPHEDGDGPIIEETQESEEYQQNLQVVLGTAIGVLAVVGLIALGLLLYRIFRARSGSFSRPSETPNDDLHLFEQDFTLDELESKPGSKQSMVLILYAQDCPAHERAVAALAGILMEAWGCLVTLDLLEEEELGRLGPEEWLLERLQEADFIVTVCSLGARIRCTKRHLHFLKWVAPIVPPDCDGDGEEGVDHKFRHVSRKNQSLLEAGQHIHEGKNKLSTQGTGRDGCNENMENTKVGEQNQESLGPDKDAAVTKSLTDGIPDYFAVAVDYVAEKMKVEREKGVGLRKFINVYFDYSARSDVPPQLEVAALYCLTQDLKLLRQHILGLPRETGSPQVNAHMTSGGEGDNRHGDAGGLSLSGDGSEKSEDLTSALLSDLDTETGQLLLVTLDEARTFFQKNPTWMDEQIERARPSPRHPAYSSSGLRGEQHTPSSSPLAGLFQRGREAGRKRWRRKKRRIERGRHDLYYHCYSGREEGSGSRGDLTKQQSSTAFGLGLVGSKDDHESWEWSEDEFSGKPTRLGRQASCEHFRMAGTDSYVHSLTRGLDSPAGGIFHGRQNSLPSSLASSSTVTVGNSGGLPLPDSATRGSPKVPPRGSILAARSKTSGVSRSADNCVRLGRGPNKDLSQPLEHDGVPCFYCNASHLEGWCSSCGWGRAGLRLKGAPEDLDPGITSSAEGGPVFPVEQQQSSTTSRQGVDTAGLLDGTRTTLQAEVYQGWTGGGDLDTLRKHEASCGTSPMVYGVRAHKPACIPANSTDSPGVGDGGSRARIQRWVSGVVAPTLSPERGNLSVHTSKQVHSSGPPPPRGISLQPLQDSRHIYSSNHHSHSRGWCGSRASLCSDTSLREDSASISSSVSDGDSLERDLRSIQRISSFHNFVASSSFVGTTSMTLPSLPATPSLLPADSVLPTHLPVTACPSSDTHKV